LTAHDVGGVIAEIREKTGQRGKRRLADAALAEYGDMAPWSLQLADQGIHLIVATLEEFGKLDGSERPESLVASGKIVQIGLSFDFHYFAARKDPMLHMLSPLYSYVNRHESAQRRQEAVDRGIYRNLIGASGEAQDPGVARVAAQEHADFVQRNASQRGAVD